MCWHFIAPATQITLSGAGDRSKMEAPWLVSGDSSRCGVYSLYVYEYNKQHNMTPEWYSMQTSYSVFLSTLYVIYKVSTVHIVKLCLCLCLLFVSHQGKTKEMYKYVTVRIERNWGHPEYTCLYKFQVHGKTRDEYNTQHNMTPEWNSMQTLI